MLQTKLLLCFIPFIAMYIFLPQLIPYSQRSFTKEPFQKCVKTNGQSSLLIGVISAPENFDKRTFIRATWGNRSYYENITINIVFVMGKQSKDIQKKINEENDNYRDILQVW